MRVGIDGTGWSNRRGYGRFARNVVGRLVEAHGDATYVFYVDETPMQQSRARRRSVEVALRRRSPARSVEADSRRGTPRSPAAVVGGLARPARRVPVPVALHLLPRDRHADRRRRARHDRRGLPAAHAADSAGKDVLVGKAEARVASRGEALHGLAGGARGARRALRPARGSRRRRSRGARLHRSARARRRRSTAALAALGLAHAVATSSMPAASARTRTRDVARCLLEAA